jgi:transcriptional regulator with XRE-family HTH domain
LALQRGPWRAARGACGARRPAGAWLFNAASGRRRAERAGLGVPAEAWLFSAASGGRRAERAGLGDGSPPLDEEHRRVIEHIREFAAQRGITISHLPDRAGVARSHFWDVLAGRKSPTVSWLARIAVALEVDIDEMLVSPLNEAGRGLTCFGTEACLTEILGGHFLMHTSANMKQFVQDLDTLRRSAVTALLTLDYQRNFEHPAADDTVIANRLEYTVRKLYQRLRIGLEFLGLTSARADLESGFQPFEDNPAGIYDSEDGDLCSSSLEHLGPYIQALESLFPHDAEATAEAIKREFLERTLWNTPKILHDRDIDPSKEKDVYAAIGSVLEIIFPDFTPNVHLSKPLKSYKPEFGILY